MRCRKVGDPHRADFLNPAFRLMSLADHHQPLFHDLHREFIPPASADFDFCFRTAGNSGDTFDQAFELGFAASLAPIQVIESRIRKSDEYILLASVRHSNGTYFSISCSPKLT